MNKPITVKLVFVVPSQIMESFQKQIIESLVLPPMDQMGLNEVPGIKEKRVKLLRDSGINTVRDLISAHRKGDVAKFSFVRKVVDEFVDRLDSGKELDDLMQAIVNIGQ
jgi:hypothetical protein